MNEEKFKFWTRRILAFLVSAPAIGVLSVLSLQGNETAIGALIGFAASVVGFYFGTRSS